MTIAFVTGGNRGIGLAACAGLARKGIKVLMGSRDLNLGHQAAEQLLEEGLEVSVIEIDVSDQQSVSHAAEEIEASHGGIDILINNAGVLPKGSLLDLSENALEEGIQVNLMGPIHCIRVFAPGMIQRDYGRIVNVSSGYGSFDEGLEGPSIYSISKAALNAVTVKAAQTLPRTVKVNAMCPGWVHTRMGGEQAPRTPEEGADTIIWLATLPAKGPTGKFFRDREQINW
ncbi:MAG: SDR family NAD(P)-dependent oxidoreductase [Chlamydiales bacterium]